MSELASSSSPITALAPSMQMRPMLWNLVLFLFAIQRHTSVCARLHYKRSLSLGAPHCRGSHAGVRMKCRTSQETPRTSLPPALSIDFHLPKRTIRPFCGVLFFTMGAHCIVTTMSSSEKATTSDFTACTRFRREKSTSCTSKPAHCTRQFFFSRVVRPGGTRASAYICTSSPVVTSNDHGFITNAVFSSIRVPFGHNFTSKPAALTNTLRTIRLAFDLRANEWIVEFFFLVAQTLRLK